MSKPRTGPIFGAGTTMVAGVPLLSISLHAAHPSNWGVEFTLELEDAREMYLMLGIAISRARKKLGEP